MPACFIILSVVATWIVLLRREVPGNDLARVAAVGDLKTNGEHWVIFRFDAPQKRAVSIVGVQVIGSDNVPEIAGSDNIRPNSTAPIYEWLNYVQSTPDSTVPIYELVKPGSSKQLKVRHAGGGEWRVQLCLMVHLELRKQYAARVEGCWRWKSLKPWTRNYVERNYRIIKSEVVRTLGSEAPRANPPTSPSSITPWSPADDVFSLR
jgi:hypothetical protein